MTELEKVIERLEYCAETRDGYVRDCINDALELLKEQEDLGTELGNAVELIHKKNERIEKLLKEKETSNLYKCPNCSTWVSAENVVRCKDCKKRNQHHECEYWYHSDDWFCADGVVKWE